MASVGVDVSSLQAGRFTAQVGLHSSYELSELSQWSRHNNSGRMVVLLAIFVVVVTVVVFFTIQQ